MMNQDLRIKYHELARISVGMQKDEWDQLPSAVRFPVVIDYLMTI